MEHLITENDDPPLTPGGHPLASDHKESPYEPTPILNALIAAGVALACGGLVYWGAMTGYRLMEAFLG